MSQPVQLPGFVLALARRLDHWGYLAVGFLLFVEDFGVPAPGRDRADRSVCLRRCRAAEHRRRRRDRLRRRSARRQHRLRDRLWAGTWSAVGYLAGNHIQAIYTQANRYASTCWPLLR